jgi:VCBS repeat-containing protein
VLNATAPGVLSNDTDPDGSDTLTVTGYDAISVQGAAVTVNADGSYSYDPTGVAAFQALAVGESAADSFTYTIGDDNGGSDTATVSITVTGVNDGPTAVDDTDSTNADVVLTVPQPGGLGNDTVPDTTDALTVTNYDVTGAQGAVVVNADGSYSYDPTGVATFQALAAGETATDSFTYTMSDGHGGSDTATVTITVWGVNGSPTAADDSGATDEDTVLTVAASGVLGNDTDPDGSDILTVASSDAVSVQGAAVTVNADGGYSYDPTGAAALQAIGEGGTMVDSFTNTADDGNGGTDVATVSIIVTGRNDAPTVGDQAFNVAENCPDDTVVGTVGAAEIDSGDALTYTIVAGDPEALFTLDPTTGVLTVNDGSKLDFETTPTYVLTVRVTDRGLLTDTAAITVNVDDAVYAPVLEIVKEGPETADAGEVVTYTFTISHAAGSDGSPVGTVVVTDSIAGVAAYVSGDTDGDGYLDADEIWIYTVTYTVQADDPSPLVNEGAVTAKDLDGNIVSATAVHSAAINEYTLDVAVVGSGTYYKGS